MDIFIPSNPEFNQIYLYKILKMYKNKKKINKNIKFIKIFPLLEILYCKKSLYYFTKYHCFNKNIIPQSYDLSNIIDRDNFITNYDENDIYILKQNIHRKKGILLIKDNIPNIINKYFEYNSVICQQFIKNPYLINNRILIVRLYLLSTIQNNEIKFYISKWGKCLFTKDIFIRNFNIFENGLIEKSRFISNSNYKWINDIENNYNLKFPKNLTDLYNYNENITFEIIIKPIKVLLKSFGKYVLKNQSITNQISNITFYDFSGIDLIMDGNNFKILEINKNPDMKNYYNNKEKEDKENILKHINYILKNNLIENTLFHLINF